MPPRLSQLEELAQRAGEILCAGLPVHPETKAGIQVDYKGAIDLVTEYDHRSEELLISEINRLFPGDRIITEESGDIAGKDCCIWYIDPLDGTVNFAHGLPIFAISLAYAEDGEVKLGVVYDPSRNECFSAERGKGAWLNKIPLHVSNTPDLDHSLLVTGFPYDISTNPENNLEYYTRFTLMTQAVRRLGSAALDLCYVAAGRFDGYWEIRLKPWDLAAGALIAQEAGAVVTKLRGEADYLNPPHSILAANPKIYPQMLEIFQNA